MAGTRVKVAGRVKGTPNKATTEFRLTVKRLIDSNSDNFGRWLTLVAEGDGADIKADPAKALGLIAQLAEFCSPKLARTESHVTPGYEKSHEEWLDGLE